jgi:hypothetical protein
MNQPKKLNTLTFRRAYLLLKVTVYDQFVKDFKGVCMINFSKIGGTHSTSRSTAMFIVGRFTAFAKVETAIIHQDS